MRKITSSFVLLVLALFLPGAACQLARIIASLQEPIQLDYGESSVLWQASQVFDLKSAFHPLQQYPHIGFNFTPLYFAIVNLLTRLIGDPLFTARLVSMIAAFWLAGLLGWIVYRATRGYGSTANRGFIAVITAVFVLQLPAMTWAPLARVDLLGVALEFSAITLVILRPASNPTQWIAFALLLLGVYTKQTLIGVPAAAIVLIGLIKPSRAIKLAATFVAAGLAVFLAFAWATDGGTIRHWIFYNVNPFSFARAISAEIAASTNLAALIAAALAALWMVAPRKRIASRLSGSAFRRTGVAFGLVLLFGLPLSLGIGKEGSNVNYCLDWQLAICPLAGIFIVWSMRQWERRDRTLALLGPFLAAALLVTAVQLDMDSANTADSVIGWSRGAHDALATRHKEDAQLETLVARFPGPVVSDNMMILLRAGKGIPFEPAIIKFATETGVFNENELVARTESRFFDAFILRADIYGVHFSPRMLNAIAQNYRRYPFEGKLYLVYVRKD